LKASASRTSATDVALKQPRKPSASGKASHAFDRSSKADDISVLRADVRASAAMYKQCDPDIINAVHAVLSTANEIHATLAIMLEGQELSYGQLNVLFVLQQADGQRLPLSRLAEKLYFSRANMTYLIDALLEKGFVERAYDENDRRIIYAHLSEKGRLFMDWFVPLRCERAAEGLAQVSREELRMLIQLLDRVRAQTQKANRIHGDGSASIAPFY
jgi:DNA-binding MarR family transcriptional regulator